MRTLGPLYTIPAHLSNVSDLRFFHANNIFFKPPPPPKASTNDIAANEDVPMGDPDSVPAPKFEGFTSEEWSYRSGLFFASSGYDGYVKLWSADDWQLLRTLPTDASKAMSVDISSDGFMIASGTYNRNFQLFAPEEI
jgi:U4/U6 small nuclear ribonucleoprotein PRP4